MKKLAVVLVGVFTFCAGSTAVAQKYEIELCIAETGGFDYSAQLIAEYLGTIGGANVYSVNGYAVRDPFPGYLNQISGTATTSPGANIEWGLTLQESSHGYPTIWDFDTDRTFNGEGVSFLVSLKTSY